MIGVRDDVKEKIDAVASEVLAALDSKNGSEIQEVLAILRKL